MYAFNLKTFTKAVSVRSNATPSDQNETELELDAA